LNKYLDDNAMYVRISDMLAVLMEQLYYQAAVSFPEKATSLFQ